MKDDEPTFPLEMHETHVGHVRRPGSSPGGNRLEDAVERSKQFGSKPEGLIAKKEDGLEFNWDNIIESAIHELNTQINHGRKIDRRNLMQLIETQAVKLLKSEVKKLGIDIDFKEIMSELRGQIESHMKLINEIIEN